MRALVQRVLQASVKVESELVASIGRGMLVFVGFTKGDSDHEIRYLRDKCLNLRIFPDNEGNMNRSLIETEGEILLVSQFTLYADTRKGRRPSFNRAAPAELASALYDDCRESFLQSYQRVQSGVFRADMKVHLVNDGPVSIWIDSDQAGFAG